MSEQEIRFHSHGGDADDGAGPDGPDVGRLLNLRSQGEAFSTAARRACTYAQRSGMSTEQLLHSIQNTSGE